METNKYKIIIIDKNLCTGCGICIGVDEDTFSFDIEGFAQANKNENISKIRKAIDKCPFDAISFDEEISEEIIIKEKKEKVKKFQFRKHIK
jgi:ferredoxin